MTESDRLFLDPRFLAAFSSAQRTIFGDTTVDYWEKTGQGRKATWDRVAATACALYLSDRTAAEMRKFAKEERAKLNPETLRLTNINLADLIIDL